MTRIFPTLGALSLMLVAMSLVFGLSIGDLYADPPTAETLAWRTRHTLTGVAAALAVVLVESIAVTYFIGTSRWCKEVTETYRLPPNDLAESTRLKRRTFPFCVLGMLAVVGVSALGAASDPGTGRPASDTAYWVNVHLAAALGGLAFVAWTYYRVWLNMAANQAVIERIVARVAQIRAERGLDGGVGAASPETVSHG
jgi:drug/metabolite transporter (DMT)-like permease